MNSEKLGLNLRRIRKEAGMTQQQVSNIIGIDRNVYSKWESGKNIPSKKYISLFAKELKIPERELWYSAGLAIADTSALLKNEALMEILTEDFAGAYIPEAVVLELEKIKDRNNKYSKKAWCVLMWIKEHKDCIVPSDGSGDIAIRAASDALSKKYRRETTIIHDNVALTLWSCNQVLLDEYMAKRQGINGFIERKRLDTMYPET